MTTSRSRIAGATLGSVAVIGGLIGAKALFPDASATIGLPPATTSPAPLSGTAHDNGHGRAPKHSTANHPASSAASPTPTQAAGGTYTGAVAATQYGDVQVQIDVSSGHIDDIRVLTYPQGTGRDQMINQYAIPVLVSEGKAAQSANVDTVSGATYTSDGYRRSLQSAIDQAGL